MTRNYLDQSKIDEVRRLRESGGKDGGKMTFRQIAEKMGRDVACVYRWWQYASGNRTPGNPGRPRKAANSGTASKNKAKTAVDN